MNIKEGFRLNSDSSIGAQPVNHSNDSGKLSGTEIQVSIVSRETETMQNESESGIEESDNVASRGDQVRDIMGNDEILNENVLLVASTDRQVVMQDEGGLQVDASLGEGRESQENTLADRERDWQSDHTEGVQIDWNGIVNIF